MEDTIKPSDSINQNQEIRHIGVILDGNRRFAKRLMLEPWNGHEYGAKKVRDLLKWCKEFNLRMATLYCFSVENFSRPKREFDYLMKLFRKEFNDLKKNESEIHKNKIKVNFIGRTHLFPEDIQNLMKELVDQSKDYNDYIVNFAMAYGGRAEIIDAVRKITDDVSKGKLNSNDIDESNFSEYLYLNDNPELIIRTSGERRLSGFLLWQSAYSEFYFSEKFWPEFSKDDFVEALKDYLGRGRRFGK